MRHFTVRSLFLTTFLLCTLCAAAYNMRRTSNSDGLTSSTVHSMAQDSKGFLWLGTLDGVCITDGATTTPFSVLYPGLSLSGNLIENIIAAPGSYMWIHTNHGLDRFNTETLELASYRHFNGQEIICTNARGDLFVLGTDSRFFYLPADADASTDFTDTKADGLNYNTTAYIAVSSDTLTVYGRDGVKAFPLTFSNGRPQLGAPRLLSDDRIAVAHADADGVLAVCENGRLHHIANNGKADDLLDLSAEIARRGAVSAVLRDASGDIYVAFESDGVIRARQMQTGDYRIADLGLKAGVFCLEKSSNQPVVWIGSDCRGLYTCYNSPYMLRSCDFVFFDKKISHPVRAIFLDSDNTLWLGTKGDGLLRSADFSNARSESGQMELYTTANSELKSNTILGLDGSVRPLLWIATDGGISYYSYRTGRIRGCADDPALKYIYSIHEENDSTLWVATAGNGIVRCRVTGAADNPVVSVAKVYRLDGGNRTSNFFFDMDADSQGNLLFANRGLGGFALAGDSLVRVPLHEKYDNNSVFDVFSVVSQDSVRWLGTGHGLFKVTDKGEKLFFGLENGFVNNTIHDMISDSEGKLWISTNNGLSRFDPLTEKTQMFGRQDGVNITEFSDGASFRNNSMLIFGGIDGIVTVTKTPGFSAAEPYLPAISLQKLIILGETVNPAGYIRHDKNGSLLELAPDQNHFAVTFSAPDFLHPMDYNFLYTLDGKEWINNGNNGTISFNKLGYGQYDLSVKYVNRVTGVESEPYHLEINLRAPWYLSTTATVIYILLLLAAVSAGVWFYILRQRRAAAEKLSMLKHQHREDLYEEKLRFFTNITHEFCTPLTLIYGPCERIMSYDATDNYIRKYVGIIRANVERLNSLIQELIDFRRIETGHKVLKIREVNISDLASDTYDSFSELAERNNIDFVADIQPDVIWNTDFSSLRKVLNNLISNAFKYTPVGGRIEVETRIDGENLRVAVYNSGKGIPEKDRERIFNRYSVLDNVEENAVKGLSARNGLGLAICHSMVKLLHGYIAIESEVGSFARFVVTLPMLETNVAETTAAITESSPAPAAPAASAPAASSPESEPAGSPSATDAPDAPAAGQTKGKSSILVIDDNTEILSLLSDSLADYRVRTAKSAEEGLDLLKKETPDVIITDIMMPGTDGLTFARQIKTNRHTMHLPLIILSAKTSIEEQVEGIASGADVFIGKPFSVSYLRAVVARLLESRNTLREYYNTSASAFEYSDGHLLERDDKDFLDRVVEYIDNNIDDVSLSPDQLAAGLRMSLRNLYRKFKELNQPTPNDFIKNHRITYAAKLLLTTSFTVQEIIYRTGFSNRSHFYKEFDKRFGITPKDYRTSNKKPSPNL